LNSSLNVFSRLSFLNALGLSVNLELSRLVMPANNHHVLA
jgi:hypothetical protein